jgi:protein-S-isoprenylcysteine O-methyltransferase Ste14
MMYWIYDYPSWIMGLLFVAVFVAVTWIGIFLSRATVHSWFHREPRANEMVSLALSSYFVLFGLLLGLLAVATYQNYTNVGDIVEQEASSISALYRDFSAYPQPIRRQLQDALREYARYTIEEGWQQQRKGILPKGEPRRSGLVAKTLLGFEPSSEAEKVIHAEALRQSSRRVELSRARMSSVALGLPAVLWWVLAFCALMNIVLIWVQDMEIHVHLILGAVLASMLGAVIFLIAELDNPFRGEVSIGPDSIARVYQTVMKPDDADKATDKLGGTGETTQLGGVSCRYASHPSECPE